ncbi:uncharacterized protein LOC133297280 [Gastrolobium bilobum]|uniref:uncharacterized protein LOC133297280 n=1 Tax=Gastrolobium bilobum TaxID=150636 RepID=UPI002AB2EB22|nr:uncharacterized protein LOC133297280 [Gastrolobium bilobum]
MSSEEYDSDSSDSLLIRLVECRICRRRRRRRRRNQDRDSSFEGSNVEVIEQLGQGGFSRVFRCRDLRTDQIVAIKQIDMLGVNEGVPSSVPREVSLLKELNHVNVVRLLNVIIPENKYANLVFEHLDCDLHDYIRDQRYPKDSMTIKSFMYQILSAVAYCHSHKILHRDLKPKNLLIDHSKKIIKLADFGLAREFGDPDMLYTAKVGTYCYRAPEILFESRQYSTPIDLWSVGCIFGEMVIGKPVLHVTNCQDEIEAIFRYVSACEAAWRIFGFDIHSRYPPVQRLTFHLPNEKNIIFSDNDSLYDVKTRAESRLSIFESWMDANKKYPEGRHLTYGEYPTEFVFKEKTHEWNPRKKGFSIGRINRFSANNGEDSYLRTLLNFQRGCTSYEDLRTINGVVFPTFKDACYSLGLLDDDNEYIDAIKEASSWGSAAYLRCLFALLLFANSMNRPEKVWEECWKFLSDDVVYRHRKRIGRQDAILTEESIKNITLEEIDKVLQSNGKCLSDYPSMPRINSETLLDMQNRLVLDELMYDIFALEEEHKRLINSLTDEQKVVYDKIVSAVTTGNGGLFFLYGFGGTRKTFIWKTLSASIRSKAGIVLNVASSGIASLLLPGGRTAHSRFRIPIQINEDSTCNIRPKSTIAELLSKTKLIIWGEAPIVHRFCFEALDRTLRDVLRISDTSCVDMPFGGKVVVLGGDFRQILPVISHGSRQDIVHATINSSHLWSHCHLLTLTKNMRLNSGSSAHNLEEIKEFSEWLLKVGDGNLGDDVDGESIITIPDELLIRESEDPLSDMVNFVYPNLLDNILDQTFFKERDILTPKLSDVAMLNEHLMSMIPGEERTFLSSDKILKQGGTSSVEDDEITPEILNTLSCSGIPDNKLILKVKVPVMLLRNIDQSRGLCNGTRLLITKLGNHVVEAIQHDADICASLHFSYD